MTSSSGGPILFETSLGGESRSSSTRRQQATSIHTQADMLLANGFMPAKPHSVPPHINGRPHGAPPGRASAHSSTSGYASSGGYSGQGQPRGGHTGQGPPRGGYNQHGPPSRPPPPRGYNGQGSPPGGYRGQGPPPGGYNGQGPPREGFTEQGYAPMDSRESGMPLEPVWNRPPIPIPRDQSPHTSHRPGLKIYDTPVSVHISSPASPNCESPTIYEQLDTPNSTYDELNERTISFNQRNTLVASDMEINRTSTLDTTSTPKHTDTTTAVKRDTTYDNEPPPPPPPIERPQSQTTLKTLPPGKCPHEMIVEEDSMEVSDTDGDHRAAYLEPYVVMNN